MKRLTAQAVDTKYLGPLEPLRNPATAQLIGRGCGDTIHRMVSLKNGLVAIKRYLYRRICNEVFLPLKCEEASKADLRRLTVWLQPIRESKPTRTESLCFHNGLGKNQGCGNPAVLFPPNNSSTKKEFYNLAFAKLKNAVFFKRRIPVGLLDLLNGKSSKEPRIQRQLPENPLKDLRICKPAPQTLSCGSHGTVARIHSRKRASLSTLETMSSLWPVTANRYSVLRDEEI